MNRSPADDSHRIAPDLSGEADAEALAETWSRLDGLGVDRRPELDVDAAWARLSARIDAAAAPAPGSPAAGPTRAPRTAAPWMRAAASVAVVLLGGAGAWSLVPASAEAGPGERLALELPSGSVVDLNAGSSLRWARGFSWLPGVERSERVVRLSGEAFFDVVPDGRPFRVETRDARVRVLGTRFNVRARPGEGTAVAVDEGSVEVRGADSETVVLTAGQRVTAGRGGLRVVSGGVEPFQAWRRGGFAVTDAPLSSVVAELERRWSVDIDTAGLPTATLERRLTLYYSGPVELDAVLDDVVTALGLRYRAVAGGWEIVPSP